MMRLQFVLALLFFSLIVNGQQKYQSLFWKITSPEQEEPSYLYGTMHVSDKIAFYLNDSFYEALLSVEYVALESDPNEWLEAFDDGRMSKEVGNQSDYYDYVGFYRAFCPEPNNEEYIGYYLSQGSQLLNGILYRNSLYEKDFQEDTYLDMFIYQTSKKYNKKFTGLEDYDISTDLVNTAMLYHDYDDDFEPWLKKLLKEKGYVELMEDAYRAQNLDFLDSLNLEFNNELYNQFMIDDRNVIIANNIDSIIQLGSVFAGIGAAHLPGKMGVIDLLIEKGYTVEAIKGDLTSKGEALNNEIRNKRTIAPFTEQVSPDGMLKVNWLNKLYEFSDGILVSPDLTNGAYVLISRMNRYTYLFHDEPCNLETLDRLIFENVPGDIISKEKIVVSGYPAIDLLNKTKDGNFQRYCIIETPLEVIILKMDGPKDYVKKFGEDFFSSISLKKTTSEKETVLANFKGYSAQVPSFHKVENHSGFASYILQPVLQGFDVVDSSFSFVVNMALSDLLYIEEDKFEERMIHKRFYETLELESAEYENDGHLISKAPIIEKDSLPTGDTLFLKTILAGNQYYLLGYYGVSSKKSNAFFNSFKQHKFEYAEQLEEKKDTVLSYSVTTYDDPPYHYLNNMFGNEEKNEKKKYQQITENYFYTAPNKEEIKLTYTQFPLYKSYENVDSLWNYFSDDKRHAIKSRSARNNPLSEYLETVKISKTERGKLANKFPYLDTYLSKEGSSKYVRSRYILNHGVLYKLSVMQDSAFAPTEFVSTFFNSFMPFDTTIGYSPFMDKTDMFLEDVYSADTLRKEAALKNIYSVKFGSEYLPQLYALIDTFPFEESELKYKANLINKVGKMDTPVTNKYIIDLYKKSEYNPVIQMAIIRALASHQKTSSTKTILDLLESDIPLAEKYVISSGFRSYSDSLELAIDLFPEFLKYSPIDEYKRMVFGLLADLREDGYNAKKYKKMKDFLVTEGRIELKRLKAKELKNSVASYRSNSLDNTMLSHYITLLSPWQHQSEIANLFHKISSVEDIETLTQLALEKGKVNKTVDIKTFKKMMESKEKIDDLVEILIKEDQEQILNLIGISQDDIAMADLIDASGDKLKTHEVLRNEELNFDGNKYKIYLYQYKIEETKSAYSYNSNDSDKWFFGAICYKIPKDGKTRLTSETFFKDTNRGYDNTVITPDDDEEIEKFYEKCLESVEYKGRKRVKVEVEEY